MSDNENEDASRPNILFIDDEPDTVSADAALALGETSEYEVLHPSDLEISHLEKADLVLVDYKLKDWKERDDLESITLKPETGVALAVLLREHVDNLLSKKERLTAFALHTGHIEVMKGRVASASAPHVVARLNNLEWVFPKTEERRYEQMVLLAKAVSSLPRRWYDDRDAVEVQVGMLLGMEMEEEANIWNERCWREVLECMVPIQDLRDGHGLVFIRWLLHQVMPYPCFLSELNWVAGRLRVEPQALKKVIGGDSDLSSDLEAMKYNGILAGFLGDRWWRGALEDYVWELTDGGDGKSLHDELQKKAGRDLRKIKSNPAVVCLDKDLQPTGNFVSPAEAVRLRPDNWPLFASTPWMEFDAVRLDESLKAMVDPMDRMRLYDR